MSQNRSSGPLKVLPQRSPKEGGGKRPFAPLSKYGNLVWETPDAYRRSYGLSGAHKQLELTDAFVVL